MLSSLDDPANMLRAEGDLLLDDKTPAELARALGADVHVVPLNGEELLIMKESDILGIIS